MSTRPPSDTHRGDLRIALVAAIVVLQAVGATFFIADAVINLSAGEWGVHIFTEVVIALALVTGVALGAWQMRQMIEQARRDAATLTLERGVADGTVRAQLTSIYTKVGVSSRHALASLFLDNLIAGPVARTDVG